MTGRSVDGAYGLLHLVDRAGAPAAQSLVRAARLTGLAEEALRTDAFANARGGAALLRAEADDFFGHAANLDESRLGDWYPVVMRASGVSNPRLADDYAAQVFRVLRDGAVSVTEGGLVRLAPQSFQVNGAIWGDLEQDLGGEYCPNGACVAFVPASTSNSTAGRGGNPIDTIVIHDMEGSYSGSIAWFQNPAAAASAHYDVRSSDGQITQQVHHGDTAWHAGNWSVNQHAIGIEHEGYAHTGSQWYTESMYKSSAALTRWLCDTFHIPQDRTHIIGHYEVPNPDHAGWFGGAGAHHDPCDTWAGDPTWHNVSACDWDWNHYLSLVTGGGVAATGTLTGFVGDACCGLGAATRKPLPGATVVLEGTAESATTNASGTYSFTVAPGNYQPRASLSGYDPADHSSIGPGYSAAIAVTAGQTSWASIILTRTAPPAQPPAPHLRIDSPSDGASAASAQVTVAGAAEGSGVRSISVDNEAVAFDPQSGAFSVQITLKPGANTIVIDAVTADAQMLEASVSVTYTGAASSPAAPKTGCGSAGSSDLLALLPLAAFLRRRR